MVRTNKHSSVWTAKKKSLTLSKQIYCSKNRRKLSGATINRILKIQIQIVFGTQRRIEQYTFTDVSEVFAA